MPEFRMRLLSCWQVLPAAVLASFLGLSAAEARVEFRGGGTVHGYSGCEAHGWQGPDTVLARFHPADLPGNGDRARLTIFWDLFAIALTTRGGQFTSSFSRVDGGAIGPGLNVFRNDGPTRNLPRVRITRQQPADITASTDAVRLEGVIRHFDGLDGCTARFEFFMRQN